MRLLRMEHVNVALTSTLGRKFAISLRRKDDVSFHGLAVSSSTGSLVAKNSLSLSPAGIHTSTISK
jgi:hypothetical protein